MSTIQHAKAVSKRRDFSFALWATVIFFGLTPLALGISLGIAQFLQVVR